MHSQRKVQELGGRVIKVNGPILIAVVKLQSVDTRISVRNGMSEPDSVTEKQMRSV